MVSLFFIYTACFCATVFTIYSKNYKNYYCAIKTLTSLFFVAVAICGYTISGNFAYFMAMLIPLVLCTIGDFFLGLASQFNNPRGKVFCMGVLSFLIAHILFYITLVFTFGIYWYDFIIPVISVGLCILVVNTKEIEMGRMKTVGIIYSFFVGLLLSKGITILLTAGLSAKPILLCLGAILFFASDVSILFLHFKKTPKKYTRFFNLFTYYLGVLLLAITVML